MKLEQSVFKILSQKKKLRTDQNDSISTLSSCERRFSQLFQKRKSLQSFEEIQDEKIQRSFSQGDLKKLDVGLERELMKRFEKSKLAQKNYSDYVDDIILNEQIWQPEHNMYYLSSVSSGKKEQNFDLHQKKIQSLKNLWSEDINTRCTTHNEDISRVIFASPFQKTDEDQNSYKSNAIKYGMIASTASHESIKNSQFLIEYPSQFQSHENTPQNNIEFKKYRQYINQKQDNSNILGNSIFQIDDKKIEQQFLSNESNSFKKNKDSFNDNFSNSKNQTQYVQNTSFQNNNNFCDYNSSNNFQYNQFNQNLYQISNNKNYQYNQDQNSFDEIQNNYKNPLIQNNFQNKQVKKSFRKESQDKNIIIYNNIDNDQRTNLMIRNIPNKYTVKQLKELIDKKYKNKYTSFNLPIDPQNQANVGYAFINFADRQSIKDFYLQFNNTRWQQFQSQKVCEIRYADIQTPVDLNESFKSNIEQLIQQQKQNQYSLNENLIR